jgi:LysM repeat protein
MRLVRQVLPGMLIALVSIVLTLGGISLAFAEGNLTMPTRTRTQTRPPTDTPTWEPFTPTVQTPTPTIFIQTFTLSPTDATCPTPEGWATYTVKSSDTLEALAGRYHTSVEMLRQANCLETDELQVGSEIHVPPLPTKTPEKCGPPPGWVLYSVQPGDTLYHISVAFGTTVEELQQANCMGNSTLIVVGKLLNVPPVVPHFFTPTNIWYFTATNTWTVIVPGTSTPTYTPTFTPPPTDTP